MSSKEGKEEVLKRYQFFDGMTWPTPDCLMGEDKSLNWKLRYAPDTLTKNDLVNIASYIGAYDQLIVHDTLKRSNKKISQLRKELGL